MRRLIGPLLIIVALVSTGCGQVVTATTPTAGRTAAALPTAAMSLSTAPPRPTATLALTTPTPVSTATPTPTPIVHKVQSGETLISIALQYGVSVPALQSANGISDPQMLQVGQSLIIPTEPEDQGGDLAPLMPTPTASPLEIEGVAFYKTPVGSLWCLGQVVNTNERPVENVELRVSLHGAAGEVLLQGVTATALDFIPAGGQAPFGILFNTPPAEFDRYLVSTVRADATGDPSGRYAELELSGLQASLEGNLFQVSGSVNNVGQAAATGISVVVTTYDEAGNVTGFRQARLPDDLDPAKALPFSLSLMPNGGAPANYEVAVQGRLADR